MKPVRDTNSEPGLPMYRAVNGLTNKENTGYAALLCVVLTV